MAAQEMAPAPASLSVVPPGGGACTAEAMRAVVMVAVAVERWVSVHGGVPAGGGACTADAIRAMVMTVERWVSVHGGRRVAAQAMALTSLVPRGGKDLAVARTVSALPERHPAAMALTRGLLRRCDCA